MIQEPWRPFSRFLRERFNCRVHRVGLDAGFSCPNRDGTRGEGGCVFCDAWGSRAEYQNPSLSVEDQMRQGMDRMERRFGAQKFIAYFQAYTNTHASPDLLRASWEAACIDDRVVGLAVATRPDCIAPEVIDLLREFTESRMTWVELGFLSEKQAVLDAANRCETVGEFESAAQQIKAAGLPLVAHVIFGLPGETLDEAGQSVHLMNRLQIDGIKIHNLYIVNNAPIVAAWRNGEIETLDRRNYIMAVVDYLERLRAECYIHRLTGDASKDRLLAPEWMGEKQVVLRLIREEFERRGTHQGSRSTG